MGTYAVTGEQYREVDRRMTEIKRRLNEPGGSPVDPDVVARKLQLILDGRTAAPLGSTTPDEAAAIMGPSFHGVEAVEHHLGTTLLPSEAAPLSAVPFSSDVLLRSRNTHVLVACASVSILGLRAKVPN